MIIQSKKLVFEASGGGWCGDLTEAGFFASPRASIAKMGLALRLKRNYLLRCLVLLIQTCRSTLGRLLHLQL